MKQSGEKKYGERDILLNEIVKLMEEVPTNATKLEYSRRIVRDISMKTLSEKQSVIPTSPTEKSRKRKLAKEDEMLQILQDNQERVAKVSEEK